MAKRKSPTKPKGKNKGCSSLIAIVVIGILYLFTQAGRDTPTTRNSSNTRVTPVSTTYRGQQSDPTATPRTSLRPASNQVMSMQETTYYTKSNVNARSCASTTCERVTLLNYGTAIQVDATVNGDEVQSGNSIWYRFTVGGQEAFVYSDTVSLNRPDPTSVPSQPQQQVGQPVQQPAQQPAAQSFTCPSNCAGAVAAGLSAQQAASCGLDRDGDGVACYGD